MVPTQPNDRPLALDLVATLLEHAANVNRPAWSPDGSLLATPDDASTVRIWIHPDYALRQELRDPKAHGRVYSVSWSPDSCLLAVGMDDPVVRVWDIRREEVVRRLRTQGERIHNVAWSPDGTILAAAARDGVIRLWSTKSWAPAVRLSKHDDWVNCLAWSPDGKRLASAGGDRDKTIKVWDIATGRVVWQQSHGDFVLAVAWSPDAQFVASGSNDNTLRIWNAVDGVPIKIIQEHQDQIRSLSFSADSRLLASKSRDGTVKIFSTADWNLQNQIDEPAAGRWAAGLAFHPRQHYLATLGNNGLYKDMAVRVWRLKADFLSSEPEHGAAAIPPTPEQPQLIIDNPLSEGDWSLPMPMVEIANRLENMTPKRAKEYFEKRGALRRVSRKSWEVRLDQLDRTIRYRIEHGKPPPDTERSR